MRPIVWAMALQEGDFSDDGLLESDDERESMTRYHGVILARRLGCTLASGSEWRLSPCPSTWRRTRVIMHPRGRLGGASLCLEGLLGF